MNFESQNKDIHELFEAIQLSNGSAAGPDAFHYQMHKHLPENSLKTLLNIFNRIWETGKFSKDRTYATIIHITEPVKILWNLINRPIALTSWLCNTLERMINGRLTWFLESNNHISRFQIRPQYN